MEDELAQFQTRLKYMAVNGGVAGLLKLGFGWLVLDFSGLNTGIVANTSVAMEFIGLLLVRVFSNTGTTVSAMKVRVRGETSCGVHLPHHLPDKVYLLMHPVGHPLNF